MVPNPKANPKPTFNLEDIPAFVVGVYQSVDLQPTDGTPPYTCKVTQGDLPKGLGFSSAGVLSGTGETPNDTNPPTVFFMVEDANAENGTRAYPVFVVAS